MLQPYVAQELQRTFSSLRFEIQIELKTFKRFPFWFLELPWSVSAKHAYLELCDKGLRIYSSRVMNSPADSKNTLKKGNVWLGRVIYCSKIVISNQGLIYLLMQVGMTLDTFIFLVLNDTEIGCHKMDHIWETNFEHITSVTVVLPTSSRKRCAIPANLFCKK